MAKGIEIIRVALNQKRGPSVRYIYLIKEEDKGFIFNRAYIFKTAFVFSGCYWIKYPEHTVSIIPLLLDGDKLRDNFINKITFPTYYRENLNFKRMEVFYNGMFYSPCTLCKYIVLQMGGECKLGGVCYLELTFERTNDE